jgi:hypothetical protein
MYGDPPVADAIGRRYRRRDIHPEEVGDGRVQREGRLGILGKLRAKLGDLRERRKEGSRGGEIKWQWERSGEVGRRGAQDVPLGGLT